VNLEQLRARGEAMSQALGRESYQAGAGLTAASHYARIFEAYADLASEDAWGAAQGHPMLLEWVADSRIGRAVAPLDDRLHGWENAAEVVLEDGERMPFHRAGIAIANEPQRERRLAMDRARRAVLAEPIAIRTARLERERDLLGELLGLDVVAARTRLSGIDLVALAEQCRGFLARTRDLHRDALAARLRQELQLPISEADRTDGAFLFRGAAWDEFFPADALTRTAISQCAEMGLDALAAGRIVHDTEDREGKRARAFCAPVRVPDEVYLVIRPHGGSVDYRAFYHELGHALHFANVGRDRPFEHRWLGDNSVTESYAMLFEHLVLTPDWLRRYTGLSGERLGTFVRNQALALLAIVRRYAAKLIYEIELQRAPSLAGAGDLYVELLSDAAGLRYAEEDALLDLDDGYYSARYLRAWQLESLLRAGLVDRFDTDWFRNPRSGSFILDLLARGQADDAGALARAVLGRPLDFADLERWCERVLG